MQKESKATQAQDEAITRAAKKRKAIASAMLRGNADSLPPSACQGFDNIVAKSRVNPSMMSNSSDPFSCLLDRRNVKYREHVLSVQPPMVRDSREINKLLGFLERGQVKEIDQWLDRKAAEGKTYWKRTLGIIRGRRPSAETMNEYVKWARMKWAGKSLKEIASRYLPGVKSAEERIRKGIEAYEAQKQMLLAK
jgi:hypothetical protein